MRRKTFKIGSMAVVAGTTILTLMIGGGFMEPVVNQYYQTVYGIAGGEHLPPSAIRRAAVHYDLTCATCHGSPANPVRGQHLKLSPPAPVLHLRADEMPPAKLFHVIKHGIAESAMPGWAASSRDDEVWDMVAFILQLHLMTPQSYRDVAGYTGVTNAALPLSTCLRCHGPEPSEGFPRLDIQTPAYIADSLRAFRARKRASGFMQSAASGLTDNDISSLARHYGRERKVQVQRDAPQLVIRGHAGRQIPSCDGCHGSQAGMRDGFPRLLGQDAQYLERQLRHFVKTPNERGGGPYADLMREAARNLEESDIEALGQWYGRQ